MDTCLRVANRFGWTFCSLRKSSLRYLAAKFKSPLYPLSDPARLAAVDVPYEVIRNKFWEQSGGFIFNKMLAPLFGIPPKQERIDECVKVLDTKLAEFATSFFPNGSQWITGSSLSVADICLGVLLTHVSWAGYEIKTPRIQKFLADFTSLPWYAETGFAKVTKK